ncbi:MAG: FprA family A-type flavoprotein [Methanomicrobiales archaeon]|nr:FprA family A-type flavoprotein [Methanomicrobiales archaeon]
MTAREMLPGIFEVGAIDWDRRLFDELIPLPQGTSYNSYLIRGSEKTLLIDTVDPPFARTLLDHLDSLGVKTIDYVVANHAEQDHSGTLGTLLARYPMVRVVTNAKCRDMLKDLLLIPDDRFQVIQDREKLSLGDRTVEFLFAPWVHWPETMLTYLHGDGVLFSCDLFGSHYATSVLFTDEDPVVYEAAKRYYAEIMMPFRSSIREHLQTIAPLEIRIIAPSHGPVYRKPAFILSAYRDWVSDRVENRVVIPYVSMHGSTAAMVRCLVDALVARKIPVQPFNLTATDTGELAKALVDAATLVVATPTTLFSPHPKAMYAVYLVNLLRPKTRWVTVIGSYGWGGKTLQMIKENLPHLKAEFLEPVMVKGFPKAEDLAALDRLADAIAERHRGLGSLGGGGP